MKENMAVLHRLYEGLYKYANGWYVENFDNRWYISHNDNWVADFATLRECRAYLGSLNDLLK